MSLTGVPSLDELLQDPMKVEALSPAVAFEILGRLVGVQALLLARAVAPSGNGHGEAAPEDSLLDVHQVAARTGHSTDWVYRHAKDLPFTKRIGREVRFSSLGLTQWMRRQGR